MAKGPYGNPLSAGIALNWEVDMTDYREDLKARKLEEAAKIKAQAKTKKAQADILKGITLDTNKVHERDRDQVSAMYAETIGDVMTLAETEQLGAIKVRQEKFERDVAPYITSLSSFNTYEGSDETKTYKDNQMARDWNDVDNITREEFFDKWGANVNLQKGAATFPVTNRIDLIGEINKRLQGVSKNVAYDSATGKPIQEGKLPTGSVIYKSEIDDPEGFIDGMTAWMLDQGVGAQYAVMGATDLKPEEFDEKTPTGTQKLAQYTRDYVANIAGPKLYGTKQERALQEKDSKGFSFGSGGAKSKRYSIMATDRPIDLSKEIGGELIGYDISDIGSSQGVRKRPIKVSKGSYFAKGGDRFIKVSNAASGEGVNLQAEPAGIYMRKDKPASEGVWLKYRTSYAPSDSGSGVQTQTSGLSVPSVDELYSKTDAEVDFFVPINSISEANQFISSMGLPKSDYERLLSDLKKRFNQTTTQSSSQVTNPFD